MENFQLAQLPKKCRFPPQPGRKPTKRKSLGIALSNGDGPGPWRPVGEPGEVVVTKSFQVYPDVGI